jgi:hypothetical protein
MSSTKTEKTPAEYVIFTVWTFPSEKLGSDAVPVFAMAVASLLSFAAAPLLWMLI